MRITSSSNRTSVPLNTHILVMRDEPSTQMELTSVNILAGGSLIIVILLLAIVRELYTCKSKKSTKNTRKQNRVSAVPANIVQEGNEFVSKEMSPKGNKTNSIQCGEAQYFTINNVLEVRHSRTNIGRRRTIRDMFTCIFNRISGIRRTTNFVEV